jgi:hypothetical protein
VIPRRLAALALAALLLGGAGVATAVNRASDDESPSAGETAAPASTTTSSFVEQDTTTTAAPAVTTTAAPARSTTTNTTRRPTTTTTRRAGATTTTTPAPPTSTTPGPACTPDHVVAAVVTDRPSYTPAQVVLVTSTLRNRSSTTCFYGGYQAGTTFRNDAGATWGGVNVVADTFAEVPLRPGETLTHRADWDHRACPEPGCGPLPPGPYYATVTWRVAAHTYEVLTSFILS